jgi:hypothetical protein
MSISNSAVLTELNISVWTANKLDKRATEDVLNTNNATIGSAQVRKNLMAGTDKRKKIADYAARIRLYHNQVTLSWSDKGARLLPTSMFMEYKQTMNVMRDNFYKMMGDFLDNYDALVANAQLHMGSLFDGDDYPTRDEVAGKFGFNLVFSPLPESGDFRLDIPAEDIRELSSSYEAQFNDRLTDAMREPWERLHKVLEHMSEKLTDIQVPEGEEVPKKRWHDTFVSNAQELCSMLTHLNVTKDPQLEAARRALEITMLGADIDDIKERPEVRSSMKAKVDEILGKFSW